MTAKFLGGSVRAWLLLTVPDPAQAFQKLLPQMMSQQWHPDWSFRRIDTLQVAGDQYNLFLALNAKDQASLNTAVLTILGLLGNPPHVVRIATSSFGVDW